MRIICFLFTAWVLSGQTLQVSSVSTTLGQSGSVLISLKSPSGSEPAALQWELKYPAEQISVPDKKIVVGSAAQAAGKDLRCVGHWLKQPQVYAYTCILGGGLKTIRDGTVAVVPFDVAATAHSGQAEIELSNVIGATPEGKAIKVGLAPGVVTIR